MDHEDLAFEAYYAKVVTHLENKFERRKPDKDTVRDDFINDIPADESAELFYHEWNQQEYEPED